jgi:hypothetical protein
MSSLRMLFHYDDFVLTTFHFCSIILRLGDERSPFSLLARYAGLLSAEINKFLYTSLLG